ncbi:MAG: hypothetical protein PHJ00_02645 [Candidatus Omnitrophica bacterium]|nr:hypothetical protein [Candidatus Omnitrophota bacterium]
MSNLRGASIIAAVKFIREKYQDEGLARVLDSLEAQDRQIAGGSLNPMSFYPARVFINFSVAADKIFGAGDYEICRQIGYFEAGDTFTGLYKIFLDIANPYFVISRAGLAWKMVHDAGELKIEQAGDKYVKGTITDFPDYHKSFCVDLAGYFTKVLELCGAKNVSIKETKCRCQGDDCCEYEVKWE